VVLGLVLTCLMNYARLEGEPPCSVLRDKQYSQILKIFYLNVVAEVNAFEVGVPISTLLMAIQGTLLALQASEPPDAAWVR
jgi:hypothetical protein